MQETWVRSWVGKISWKRKWQPTLVFLPGESHGWRSLMGCSPRGCEESDTTERLHFRFLSLSNYGEGNEDNGDLLQNIPCTYCYTQCPQLCSRPPPTHASTGDSWTLEGKPGSVSCGVTASFSWVLVHTRFCLCPPTSLPPVQCPSSQSYGFSRSHVEKEMATHSSTLTWKIPRTKEPGRLQSMGSQRVGHD